MESPGRALNFLPSLAQTRFPRSGRIPCISVSATQFAQRRVLLHPVDLNSGVVSLNAPP